MNSTAIATHEVFASRTATVLARLRASLDSTPIDRQAPEVGRAGHVRAGELLLRLHPGHRASGASGNASFVVSGVVVQAGADADDHVVGDQVFGVARDHHFRGADGFAVTSVAHVARMPRSLSPEQAVSLVSSATMAWRMLFRLGRLEPGEILTVITARSAVGAFALQLARAHGVHAIAVTPSDCGRRLRELGALRVEDMRAGALESACRVAAVVVDAMGGFIQRRALSAMQEGSVLLSCVGMPDMSKAPKGVRGELVAPAVTARDLERVAALADAGHLAPAPEGWRW